MDPTAFDALVRSVATSNTRRRVLRLIAALPLGGLLIANDDAALAERPRDRLRRRNAQRRRKQRNRQQQNNNGNNNKGSNNGNSKNKNKNKGGGLGGSQCGATGSDCTQDSDCCTSNCFNFQCAEFVHQCSAGGTTIPCRPPAKGCAGDQCCHGALGCNDGCCEGAANQCNGEGNCCAPNCSGKQCGPDGCNAGGTCGTCPNGSTCDAATGQCQGSCIPQCANTTCGPDGCGGTCETCTNGLCVDGACQPCDVCPTCRYTTIQEAIDDSLGPEIIRICPGTYTEALRIDRDVLLFGSGQGDGPGDTIVNPPDQDTGIFIPAGVGSVEIQRLRITGSTFRGINHEGSQLTMTNCTVTGNSNGQIGPAGILTSGTLSMVNCTISDNRVDGNGGSAFGGGIGIDNAVVTLKNCLVTENSVIGTEPTRTLGGGILVGATSTLTLINSRVTGNFTNGLGGGIYVDDTSTATLEEGSTVTLNDPTNCAGTAVAGCSG